VGDQIVKVFISSVVRNFEVYRAAARRAVGLLQHQAIMCEDFGARPDSSEVACMTEVDQADVVVVILGADFGFKTPTGESVTQQEFRRARAGGKRVLAFLQDVPVEGHQEHSGGRYRTMLMAYSGPPSGTSTNSQTPSSRR
jgi:hypothetical protein